jgi:hypothetical protein
LDAAAGFFADQFVTGWESLEATVTLERCPEDRPVLALALHAGCDFVVTDERRLVRRSTRSEPGVAAVTAGAFACELLEVRGTGASQP